MGAGNADRMLVCRRLMGSPSVLRTLVLPALLLLVAMFNLTLPVAGLKELVLDELGGDVGDAAWFLSIEMFAYLLFAPLWGVLSDRTGRRKPLVAGGFLASAAITWAATQAPSVGWLLAARFALGAAAVAAWSTLMALAMDHAPSERRGRSMGVLGAALMLGVGLGAPMGGYFSRDLGPRGPLLVAAGLFLVAGLLAFALRDAAQQGRVVPLREIVTTLRQSPRLLVPWGFYFVDRLTIGLFLVALPLHLASLGTDDPVIRGRYLALFLLPFAFLQPVTGRLVERTGALPPLVWGSLIYGLALGACGWASLDQLWLAMATLGILAAVMFPPTMVLTAAYSSPTSRASAVAGFNLAGSLGFAIGPVLGAWAQEAGGYQLTFLLAGGFEVAAALAGLLVLRRLGPQPAAR
jgi:MFS family permease